MVASDSTSESWTGSWIAALKRFPSVSASSALRLVEPLNTCHKAIYTADPQPGDVVVVLGQGPIGLMFTLLARRAGARLVATDTIVARLRLSRQFGRKWLSIREG